MGRLRRAKVGLPTLVSTLTVRVLTRCGHRSSRRGPSVNELERTAPVSDEAAEELVREQAAAGRQDDPVVRCDVEQLRRERPAEGVGERRLLGGGERDAGVEPQAEDDAAPRRRSPASIGLGPARREARRAIRRPASAPRRSRRGARRSSGGSAPSNACAPGPDRLVRPALPVGQVVPALVAGLGPVADLVAAEPGLARGGRRRGGTGPRRGPRPGRARAISRQRRAPEVVGRWSPSGPVSPSASGSSRVSAYSERWSGASSSAASSVVIQPATLWSGTSYRRSRLTERMPAVAGLGHRVADVPRLVAATDPAELAVIQRLRPERQPRDPGRGPRRPRRRARPVRDWPRA